MAIGIGTGSVYETSITLHHIYGIPFIPAQSIKGALRSYIIVNYFDGSEDSAFDDEGFVDVFGSNDNQGKVIFFDAFTKESEIKIDIMNNHYQKYYNGTQTPNDTQNPNPVNFMTLKNAKFEITIATKDNIKIKEGLFKGKDILTLVKEELSNTLEVFGIGAKTAIGYGYFEVQKTEAELKAEKEAQQKKRKEEQQKKEEEARKKREQEKANKIVGFSQLNECTDSDQGLKIIKDSLGKKPEFTDVQLETVKSFYNKSKNKKKYKKKTITTYEGWVK